MTNIKKVPGNIQIVIGSWGSYNACNERALGSKWLDLPDYNDWDECAEELREQGFELDGIDEELFIQDCEGISGFNADYMTPERLFNVCYEADILMNNNKYEVAAAYLEVMSFSDFEDLVDRYGSNWDRDIYLYKGMSIEDVLQNLVEECYDLNFQNSAGYQIT